MLANTPPKVVFGIVSGLLALPTSGFAQRWCGAVYEHIQFRGSSLNLSSGTIEMRLPPSLDRKVSSLRVAPGCLMTLYARPVRAVANDFAPGDHWKLTGAVNNDEAGMVSCVCKGPATIGVQPPPQPPGIIDRPD